MRWLSFLGLDNIKTQGEGVASLWLGVSRFARMNAD